VSSPWERRPSDYEPEKLLSRFWSGDVSARLYDLLRCVGLALFVHTVASSAGEAGGSIIAQQGMDPAWASDYPSVAAKNPWFPALLDAAPGRAVLGSEIVPAWELVRTSFYRTWLRPLNLRHALIGIVYRDPERSRSIFLAALRAADQAPFGWMEKQILEALLPTLAKTALLGMKLRALASAADELRTTLDVCSDAVILVDKRAHPLILNTAAKSLLAQGHGIALSQGMLTAGSVSETELLRRLIAADKSAAQANMMIVCRSCGTPLSLQFVPFPSHLRLDENSCGAAVAIVARGPSCNETGNLFRDFYGMTRAEARLAALIAGGYSLIDAAAILNISHNTARTHMKRVYSKTNTHRQVGLIRLLGTGSPCHSTHSWLPQSGEPRHALAGRPFRVA
jgi:DNA-binding CsgD family transcriptional regulator